MSQQTDPSTLPKIPPQALVQQDISPDGTVIQTSAKVSTQQPPPTAPATTPPPKSMADLPPADGQPPAKIDEAVEPEIDFNQFVDAGAKAPGVVKQATKSKQDDTQQKPPATVPNASTAKQVDTTTTPPATTTQRQVLPDNRDYSKYPPEEHAALKKMSNEAWTTFEKYYNEKKQLEVEKEKLKKEYDEFKQKGPQIPPSYYEHQEAYLLDPEYRQQTQYLNEANLILNHWQSQLAKVAEGAVDFDYLGRNNQGQLAITGKVKADRMSELQLQQYVMHAQNLVNEAVGNVRGMIQSHGVKYQSHLQNIKGLEATMFGGMDAPDNKPIYEPLVRQKFDTSLKGFEQNPLAPGYAKALVMLEVLSRQVMQLRGNGNGATTNQQQAAAIRQQGPTGGEINGDGGRSKSGVEAEVSFDDFKKVKAGI